MSRLTRLELLEYAQEGLIMLIGTHTGGSGYDEAIEEWEDHLEWVEKQIDKIKAKEAL